jgi:predicted DCC family thiol-disulfide oxidoreductase YuxK
MKECETPLLLYDGTCGLCNRSVLFILRYERRAILRFVSQQSVKGKDIMMEFDLSVSDQQSLILIDEGQVYLKSDGVIRAAILMGGYWKYFRFFRFVPLFIRDGVYDGIASIRYSIFGKSNDCAFLPFVDRKRFL